MTSMGQGNPQADTDTFTSDPLAWSLAKYQGDSFDRLLLPGLAIGYSASVATLIILFIRFFLPDLTLPAWLLPASVLMATEGVYAGQVFRATRAPRIVRAFEISLVFTTAYGLLWWTLPRELSFFSLANLKNPAFYVPLVIAFTAWQTARSSGRTFAQIGDIRRDLGDRSPATLSWEQEALTTEGSVDAGRVWAVRFFSRRLLITGAIAAVSTAIAAYGYAERYQEMVPWKWLLLAAFLALWLFGLTLCGCVHLYRMRTLWREASVQTPKGIEWTWLRNLTVLVLIVLIVATILPVIPAPFDLSAMGERIGAFFHSLGGRQFQRSESSMPVSPVPTAPFEVEEPSTFMSIFSLVTLIFLAFTAVAAILSFLFAVGMILAHLLGDERERVRGLRRLIIAYYLWCRHTFSLVLAKASQAWKRLKQRRKPSPFNKPVIQVAEMPAGTTLRFGIRRPMALIRRVYLQLIEEAEERGVRRNPSDTPYEFAKKLKAAALQDEIGDDTSNPVESRPPPSSDAALHSELGSNVDFLTDQFVRERYGEIPIGPSQEPAIVSAWRKVTERLRTLLGDPKN